jgi:peptidoglycan hydrolase-like protein with peptidoglycan-binding domain
MVEVRRYSAAMTLLAALLLTPVAARAQQNQSPPRPQPAGQPAAGNQSPAAPGNQTPAAPQPPAGLPLYISPGIVQQIQAKLLALGLPVPTVSGAWGDNSAAALRMFQTKNGLDAGGDLDELTLLALGLPEVLRGETPAGGDAAVSAQAAATGGAQVHASPRLARVVQAKLTEAGFPTDNVFGIWLAGSETAARNFQKARNLEITGTLDLRLIHELGLNASLTEPKPGKLPTDLPAQILSDKAATFTGVPLAISATGIRQIQTALQQRGFKEVATDGRWNDGAAAALKKFQESQKLEPTGSVNLRTLRALGFTNPLVDLDVATPAAPRTTK